ncbi:MAG: GGDEF domain-containing protein [Rhodocyclaceae bacterium]|nr:GGDEF domain-containing protein [Rhodocyclaceae bacterium]
MDAGEQGRNEAVRRIITRGLLRPVFQPIIDFRIRGVLGYEALIRGPVDSPLQFPAELFAAARAAGLATELEHVARETSLREFALSGLPGRLFLNVTPGVLFSDEWMNGATRRLLGELGMAENRIVIELTENEKIASLPELREALQYFRGRGFQIAIDDLGEGFANLRMWSEVRPEFVKIDKHFVHGIAEDRMKYHFVRAMQDLAESCNATLVAEGIERSEDFDCVRAMGIACAQGYFIARPGPTNEISVSPTVQALLRESALSLPPLRLQGVTTRTAAELARSIIPAPADATNDFVFARFESDPALDVLPVVCAGQPIGLINRHSMIDRFARPFRKELYGRRSCQQFMDPSPLVVDQQATLQELAMMFAQAPRHYLFDGFIVTSEGRYLGVGSSHDLMAAITEMQISAARYANPLTQLPGNVPINEQVDRLLASNTPFVAAYVDIDSFKPFNDTFGYRRGDDVILMLAQLLCDQVGDRRDFVGHVGGDDFFIIFQSPDWEQRCLNILREFSQAVSALVAPEECPMGGYMAENRRGELVFQHLPTLSIGAVRVGAGEFESHREVSTAAAEAKKHAKKEAKRHPGQAHAGQFFVERRQIGGRRFADCPPPFIN